MANIGLNIEQMDRIFNELYNATGTDPFIGNDSYKPTHYLKSISGLVAGSDVEGVVNKTISKFDSIYSDLGNNYLKIRDFLYSQIQDYRKIKVDFCERIQNSLQELDSISQELSSYNSAANNTTAVNNAANVAVNTATTAVSQVTDVVSSVASSFSTLS